MLFVRIQLTSNDLLDRYDNSLTKLLRWCIIIVIETNMLLLVIDFSAVNGKPSERFESFIPHCMFSFLLAAMWGERLMYNEHYFRIYCKYKLFYRQWIYNVSSRFDIYFVKCTYIKVCVIDSQVRILLFD